MFSMHSLRSFIIWKLFILLSAIALKLGQSRIVLFGEELIITEMMEFIFDMPG